MKAALLKVKYQVLSGLILSIAGSIATYVAESRELNSAAERLASEQVGELENRITLAQAELDSASVLIAQARMTVPMFKDYVDRLPLSKARNVPWLLAFITASDDVPVFEAGMRMELEAPDYRVIRDPKSGAALAPVVLALGGTDLRVLGSDLMIQHELAPFFAMGQAGVHPLAAEPLVLLSGNGFPAETVYMARLLPQAGADAAASRASIILRGLAASNLAKSANLGDRQSLRLTDLSQVPPRPILLSGSAPETFDWFPETAISVGKYQLGVTLSRPMPTQRPWWWLVTLTIGLLTTGFYAALRSGLIVGERAKLLNNILSSTEHTLVETQRREVAFFENAGTANCETDYATGTILRVNDSFLAMLGYPRDEIVGKQFVDITHPGDIALSKTAMVDEAGNPKQQLQFEKRYLRKDGTAFWALVNAKLYLDRSGKASSYMTVIINIDDRKRDEATKALLARELAHRVRNTVQLTSSLARQTAATARSVKDYDVKFHRRLAALSAAQDILFDRNWVSASLPRIAQATLMPFIPEDGTMAALSIKLPDVELPTQQAQTIAVALHELASNSSNFGALANGGKVTVSGTLLDDGNTGRKRLLLSWDEQSVKPIRKPRRSGFGTRMLMSAMPEQFNGSAKATWRRHGYLYEAMLNLPEVLAQ